MLALLLDVSWKAALLFTAAWLVSLGLRRASAAARHAVWTAAAGGALLLPVLATFLPAWEMQVPAKLLPAVAFRMDVRAAQVARSHVAAAIPQGMPTRVAQRPDSSGIDTASVLIGIWMAGAVLVWLRLAAAFGAVRRATRAARIDPESSNLARELGAQAGFRREVRVLLAEGQSMPVTFGLRRPVILLPSDARTWPAERLRVVLLHELAHVERYDCLTQVLMRLVCTVYWFHPLAWVAERRFLRERERACDDLVLENGERASDYAQHLLEVARALPSGAGPAWASVAMARRSQLEGRLRAILDTNVRRGHVGRLGAATAGVLAVACVLPLAILHAGQAASNTAAQVPVFRAQGDSLGSAAQANPTAAVSESEVQAYVRQGDYSSLEKIAQALSSQHKTTEAEDLYQRALQLRAAKFGATSPEYADGLVKLAKISKDAKQYWQSALEIREAALGPEHPELAEPLYHVALEAHGHQHYADAELLYQRALAISTKAGAGRPGQTLLLANLALLREQQGNQAEAEQLYKRAVSSAAADSPERATALELEARWLRQAGRETEAHVAEQEASRIRVKSFAKVAAVQPLGKALHVGAGTAAPKLVSKVEPEYTEEARLAKYQGTAILYIEVGLDGKAHNLKLAHSLGMGLDEKAASAIEQWVFQPGVKGGSPVVVAATVEVNFRLL